GDYSNDGQTYQTLALHWNGSSWSQIPSPNPQGSDQFVAVAAVATNDVWAVGPNGLIEHWNGSTWSVVPGAGGPLYGGAAIAANDAWAVGNCDVCGEVYHVASMHWNGSIWTEVPITDRHTGAFSTLYGVAAVTSNDVWAVGYDTVGTGSRTLIEHYPAPPCAV